MKEEAPRALAETQLLLRRLITARDGVRPALAEADDGSDLHLAEVIRDDAPLSAVERLEVYANAYFFRILEVLGKDYPALKAMAGEERFHHLVTEYLIAHPPTRFSLRYAGEQLPAFVANHPAAAILRDDFPQAADLSALEWAIIDAFDAADVPCLSREDLARVPAGDWAALRLTLDPSLRLLRVRWPVHRIREASDAERPFPSIVPDVPEEAVLCVWRKDERVFHRALDPLEAACLGLLHEGATFGALCERIAREVGETQTPARALALLTGWIESGLLSCPA